jgi:Domain of unknown function (DUF4276)
VSTKIYVEGGGDHKRTITACRAGFGRYFEKIIPAGSLPRIVACGTRNKAYEDFARGLDDPKYDHILLLVDSESGVADGDDGWRHLQRRDGWAKPASAGDDSVHLMTQCMESWFLADKDRLAKYYGQSFKRGALPARKEIEQIAKADVHQALANATKHTKKGLYHKTRHGFEILAAIDPTKVEAVSEFAHQLHEALKE